MQDYLSQRKRVITILAPTVFGIFYMLICMTCLQRSVNLGEAYAAYLTHFNFLDIANLSGFGTQPPLFFIFLKIWAHIFGRTDFALRFFSVFCGAVAIMFAYMWMKYKYGAKAASLGGLFLSLSPLFIHAGQTIQPFTMAVAIVFASTYFLQLALDNEKQKWWLIYAVLVATGLWTSYYAVFAFLAQFVYLCFVYGKRVFQKRVFLTFGLAFLLFALWLPTLVRQLPRFGANPINLENFTNFWAQSLLLSDTGEVSGVLLLLSLATFIIIALLAIKYRHGLRLLLSMILVPVLALFLISFTPFALELSADTLLYVAVSAAMLAGIVIVIFTNNLRLKSAGRKKSNLAFALCSVIVLLCNASGISASFELPDDGYQKLHQNLATVNVAEQLPVLTSSPWLYYSLSFYDSPATQSYFLSKDANYDSGLLKPLEESYFGKISDLEKYLADNHYGGFWLVDYTPSRGELTSPIDGFVASEVLTLQFDDRAASFEAVHFTTE